MICHSSTTSATQNITPQGRPAGSCPPLYILKEAQKKINRLHAEIILAYLLGLNRTELYIYEGEPNEEIIKKFNLFVKERANGRPLQYIIGKTNFMGLEFIITPDVFIPRPETEILVQAVIDLVHDSRFTIHDPRILDLGTGSGNIAIALTKFITDCKIIGSDISHQALCVAKENAKLNLVDKKIDFVLSDLFEDLPKIGFDVIISNPPYIASSEICNLQKEISFEPRIALDGGPEGLDFYRKIIKGASKFLTKDGFLVLEIGFNQAQEIKSLLNRGDFLNIKFIEDYNLIKRVVIAQWIPLQTVVQVTGRKGGL